MQRSIISILLSAIIILPAWAKSADVTTAFLQFQRAVYYARALTDMYPWVSAMEVQNLKSITDLKMQEKKLMSFKGQYLEEPTITEQTAIANGVRLSGTAIAIINGKRHRGKFHYVMKQEGGRWVSWSRQFIGDPE